MTLRFRVVRASQQHWEQAVDAPHICLAWHGRLPAITNATFVITDEAPTTQHHHPNSMGIMSGVVHSVRWTVCICLPFHYHMGYFYGYTSFHSFLCQSAKPWYCCDTVLVSAEWVCLFTLASFLTPCKSEFSAMKARLSWMRQQKGRSLHISFFLSSTVLADPFFHSSEE